MHIVEKSKGILHSRKARELDPNHAGVLKNRLAQKIIRALKEESKYPKAIAQELKTHEQKVYYHIRKLEKAGIVKIANTKYIGGTKTNFYELTSEAYVVKVKDPTGNSNIDEQTYNAQQFLEPFIEDGKMNAIIVVGSPDPHGPQKARSRDGYYGMDFALFLGSYLNDIPDLSVRLDTEVNEAELMRNNIILLGGPIVNAVVEKVQKKMPIQIKNHTIVSQKTKKEYFNEETGFIVRMPNPYNNKKQMLVIVGLRYTGTRACMILFQKRFKELIKRFNPKHKIFSCVLEGYDMNSDGIVDDVKILE